MLPKRTSQHISESISKIIFAQKVPDNWLVRDMTERDYGIDFYMELVNSRSELNGDLILVQLKSRAEIKWNKKGEFKLTGIKPSTNNYWYGLPVPVFIFLIDIKNNECYYTSVKHCIRKNFDSLVYSKPFNYEFIKSIELFDKTQVFSIKAFKFFYFQDKHRDRFESELIYFLSNLERISIFIEDHIERDAHLGIENNELILIEAIFSNLKFLCIIMRIEWGIDPLFKIKKESQEAFGNNYELYEHNLIKLNIQLKAKIPLIINKIHEIFGYESSYWSIMNKTLLNFVKTVKYPIDI